MKLHIATHNFHVTIKGGTAHAITKCTKFDEGNDEKTGVSMLAGSFKDAGKVYQHAYNSRLHTGQHTYFKSSYSVHATSFK